MVKKAEAEAAIRHLATKWASETNYVAKPGWYPSFSDFKDWLSANHFGHYLNFRSTFSASTVAEHWFEDELKRWGRGPF